MIVKRTINTASMSFLLILSLMIFSGVTINAESITYDKIHDQVFSLNEESKKISDEGMLFYVLL